MHCKKCLHYEVCVKLRKPSLYGINQEIGCSAYKDKTKWVEKKNGKWVKNLQEDNAVPVSKLEELRDYLYSEDLIFMRGLAELNKLIASCGAKTDEEE